MRAERDCAIAPASNSADIVVVVVDCCSVGYFNHCHSFRMDGRRESDAEMGRLTELLDANKLQIYIISAHITITMRYCVPKFGGSIRRRRRQRINYYRRRQRNAHYERERGPFILACSYIVKLLMKSIYLYIYIGPA